ncbi:hypothetical protein [Haliscomenobacter hydrossis]|uniref:Uncharacterized protein n=1 Tax=Haliscomenobacter hydrossis (strain ATCC 27775 / DSM 1100 / LMG 10767 / O) TaxID=760192 RepID=F4KZ79_HALH1|nr:hypothetical protein [Haliscomenobacter hydrossis]AEE53733.1 hypothetical protein Halhy_5910 [Haliscomenobacter hydrossis DSM 1100]
MAAISSTTPNISGAYSTMVKLSDGSITSLANFLRAPGVLTITGYISGAYNSMVKLSDNTIVELAAYWKTPGALTIAGSTQVLGYGGMIKDADGNLQTIANQARIQYVAPGP